MKRFFLPFLLLGGCVFASPLTVLQLSGSAKSYVVGNQTMSITPAAGFTFTPIVSGGYYGGTAMNWVDISIYDFSNPFAIQFWFLDLAAPKGQVLTTGVYAGATRFPFEASDDPGLTLAGDGRGDDLSTGYFDILDISFSNGKLLSLAADFVQYDELNPLAISRGSIRYNSNVPLPSPVPEPAAWSLLGMGGVGIAFAGLKRSSRAGAQA